MTSPASTARPFTIVAASVLLVFQALSFAGLAAGVAVSASSGGEGAAYPVVLFAALVAVLVLLVAAQLWRLRRWARGAAVAWSILLILVALSQLSSNVLFALSVALVAVATLVAALASTTRLALDQAAGPDDTDAAVERNGGTKR